MIERATGDATDGARHASDGVPKLSAPGDDRETAGRNAERLVHDRLRAALPAPVAILFDSIRRFKGLERPVIVLAELPAGDPRLDQLLYSGASRARQHLVVIGPAAVLERLR